MDGNAAALTAQERGLLLHLQHQALDYFLDNQMPCGLVLDRQHNRGPRRSHGLCSTSATGMGFIALALATAPPHRLLSASQAVERIRKGLETARDQLPHDHGIGPHFVDSATGDLVGGDQFSTVDFSWFLAGALWAAEFLRDRPLQDLAVALYERVDWHYWTAPDLPDGRGLLRHGKGRDDRFLRCCWDRLNGETAFMYVLGAGAGDRRALGARSWLTLQPFYGRVAAVEFNNADLGLFVFQYGLDLLDLQDWRAPGSVDLLAEARLAALANEQACRASAAGFNTYHRFWGLSAGDGPGDPPRPDSYRCYAPSGPVDGTAHVTATLASVASCPGPVLENLQQAQHERWLNPAGRYGFSNLNLDRHWVGSDMVGIDAGAAVLALDNFLMDHRVRRVFQSLPCVQRGCERLGFQRTASVARREEAPAVRQAS